MVSAENDAVQGAKVGGVGDVLRDLPSALIHEGAEVRCVIPSYGFLARLEGVEKIAEVRLAFASKFNTVDVLRLKGKAGECDHYIFHHEEFYLEDESVYHNDKDGRPFATDARKFAFFNACVAQALVQGILPMPDILHCHDWHTAFLLILLRFDPSLASLNAIKTVFTIHNLAMQGIRPLTGDSSSFELWFPKLPYSPNMIKDPRYPDCINPMRAGILLADKVNTVSQRYAEEILRRSDHPHGKYGGDGLESDIQVRKSRNELFGILNGCEYPTRTKRRALSKTHLAKIMARSVELWASRHDTIKTAHWLADKHIARWAKTKAVGMTITSIGRLTEQKIRILHTSLPSGKTALQAILDILGKSGTLILLGSGDQELERFITDTAAINENFIFLNGYSDELSAALYDSGDLFLMPSSYEPCGISQMLAMRSGQPCLVNGVGGLRDTVEHGKTGFVFEGDGSDEQAEALITLFQHVLTLFEENPEKWKKVAKAAGEKRFTWGAAADQYLEMMY
ncbi:MAG: glycogen synthase [Agarilytica sp.]